MKTDYTKRSLSGVAAALLVFIAGVSPTMAQSSSGKPAKAVAAAPATPGDSGLKSRVETLEEQLVDMQVVVGTLESLAKNGAPAQPPFPAAAAAPAVPSGEDATRIQGLETQVKALTSQVQQLSDQVRGMGGTPRRSDIPASTDTAEAAPASNFGSTTVAPEGDAIGGVLNGDGPPQSGSAPAAGAAASAPASSTTSSALPPVNAPSQVATSALPDAAADPKQLYETAYGYLLQRDYGAAQASFDDFLKKFPQDSLAGNAQYWLGETYFVRGQYKAAASAFLNGYQTYAQSAKAPDSLLKLAMSLDRLGQKDAACSSFAELSSKFPSASANVKARAQSERQRIGCQ